MDDNIVIRDLRPGVALATSDGIWMMNSRWPFLYFYDFSKNRISFLRYIDEAGVNSPGLYSTSMHLIGDKKLIIVPFWGSYIFIYDIKKDSFEKISVQNSTIIKGLFRTSFISGDYLYCIPCGYPNVVKVNIKTYSIEYGVDWLSYCRSRDAVLGAPVRIGKHVICSLQNENTLLVYDLETERWHSEVIDNSIYGLLGLLAKWNRIYGCDIKGNRIVSLDPYDYKVTNDYKMNRSNERLNFLNEGKMLIRSVSDGKCFFCDKDFNIYRSIEKEGFTDLETALSKCRYISFTEDSKGNIYYISEEIIIVIDEHNGIQVHKLIWNKEMENYILDCIRTNAVRSKEAILESEELNIREYSRLLVEKYGRK